MRLDIVFPAHNEERRIGRTLSAYRAAFPHPLTRFHVAMDACTDGTARVVAANSGNANAATGAPMRSDPKLGKACACLPSMKHACASSSEVVTTPWPPRPWIRT